MNSSTRTLLSLKKQNDTNNVLRKKKKEILDIVYTELREIDALNKKIMKQLENKKMYFKKVKKFDKIYQNMDANIEKTVQKKQDIEDALSDFLKDNKNYINNINSKINRIESNIRMILSCRAARPDPLNGIVLRDPLTFIRSVMIQ